MCSVAERQFISYQLLNLLSRRVLNPDPLFSIGCNNHHFCLACFKYVANYNLQNDKSHVLTYDL